MEHGEDRDHKRLLEETNALLKLTGYGNHAFENINELVSSISSMCVALYERFFDVRLDNVRREPRTLDDYSHNAQLVVDGLSAALLTEELQHVTGAKVCGGDLACIRELVRVLTQVYQVLHRPASRLASSSSSNDLALDETFYIKRQPKKKKSRTKKSANTSSKTTIELGDPSLLTTKKYGRFVPLGGSSNAGSNNGGNDRWPQPNGASKASRGNQSTASRPRSFTSAKSKSNAVSNSTRPPTTSTPVVRALGFGSVSSVSLADSGDNELTGLTFSDSNDDLTSVSRLSRELSEGASELAGVPPRQDTRHEHDGGSLHVDDLAAPQEKPPTPPSQLSKPLQSTQAIFPSSFTSWNADDAPRSPEPTKSRPVTIQQPPAAPSKLFKSHVAKVRPLHRVATPASKDRVQQRRYKALLNEHVKDMRVKEMKLNQHIARSFQNRKHADHIEQIRTKKLHDELKLQRIALSVQQKRVEAQNLKNTMEHILSLEKMRLKQEHEMTTAALHAIHRQHADREQALENYFANQIELVKEQREHEVRERTLVQQAHKLASEQMLRELRSSREMEVAALMEQRRHLADVQQVRQEWKAERFVQQKTMHLMDFSKKKMDPFYAAAMKSRAKRIEGAIQTGAKGRIVKSVDK
ncbi:hypothetical protein H310_04028 [Aphanomyces invadans]|uniref:DUF5745 domain-containing protein n=1 Tax=Aphanomyces invadans TaxID=157072 RepID=A0A024UH65_9STRA|nr:hypothetical protein H310_04028 [Aphanomyces invadans]ETW04928.1 hypothetical protein H310_04028 [Aphanomyces invadans]|eukprot:XP_008866366.1 hypothetical protein H310_04028 [Aphanomyces invadans]